MRAEQAEALARRVLGPAAALESLRVADAITFRSVEGIVRVTPRDVRSVDELAAEVVASRALQAAGVPVAAAIEGPHLFAEAVVVLWEDVPDSGPRDAAAYASMGRGLRALHEHGGSLLELGTVRARPWRPLAWLERRLERAGGSLDAGLAATVRARAADCANALVGEPTLLHTDAHAANFRIAPDGSAVLVDLEGIASGPWRYDLAPMAVVESRYGGDPALWRAMVAGYGADPDDADLARLVRLREYLAVGWVLGQAAVDPTANDVARARLGDLEHDRAAVWAVR